MIVTKRESMASLIHEIMGAARLRDHVMLSYPLRPHVRSQPRTSSARTGP